MLKAESERITFIKVGNVLREQISVIHSKLLQDNLACWSNACNACWPKACRPNACWPDVFDPKTWNREIDFGPVFFSKLASPQIATLRNKLERFPPLSYI